MGYFKDRLKEASTWAGLGVIATLGAAIFPAHAAVFSAVAGAAASLAAIIKG